MQVVFLGTASGGGPSDTRNCSSLVIDGLRDGSLWMVDCGEGTLRQFSTQPSRQTHLRVHKVTKMFITHMHADHVMGIVPLLRTILYPPLVGANPRVDASTNPRTKPPSIELYGPQGLRTFVRSIMNMTFTRTCDRYTVHELLTPEDNITPCGEVDLHFNEAPGRDIICSQIDGLWHNLTVAPGRFGPVQVDAGPIIHRDPCIGYTFYEPQPPSRKLVVLGDTSDPTPLLPLCISPSPSLLIHEASDAHIPRHVDVSLSKRPPEVITGRALARGHSTPTMAGEFAKRIGAERLVLNHIGGRFPAPRNNRDKRVDIIEELERQATDAWGTGRRAQVAYDYMRVFIPASTQTPPACTDGGVPVSTTKMTVDGNGSFGTDFQSCQPQSSDDIQQSHSNHGRGRRRHR